MFQSRSARFQRSVVVKEILKSKPTTSKDATKTKSDISWWVNWPVCLARNQPDKSQRVHQAKVSPLSQLIAISQSLNIYCEDDLVPTLSVCSHAKICRSTFWRLILKSLVRFKKLLYCNWYLSQAKFLWYSRKWWTERTYRLLSLSRFPSDVDTYFCRPWGLSDRLAA